MCPLQMHSVPLPSYLDKAFSAVRSRVRRRTPFRAAPLSVSHQTPVGVLSDTMRVRRVPRHLTPRVWPSGPACGHPRMVASTHFSLFGSSFFSPPCRPPPPYTVSPPPSRFAPGATTPLRGVRGREKKRRSRREHPLVGLLRGSNRSVGSWMRGGRATVAQTDKCL